MVPLPDLLKDTSTVPIVGLMNDVGNVIFSSKYDPILEVTQLNERFVAFTLSSDHMVLITYSYILMDDKARVDIFSIFARKEFCKQFQKIRSKIIRISSCKGS